MLGEFYMGTYRNYNDRVNEILDAGERLFSQKGYEKTTVNDILKQVEIGKGTFYHYFDSKEEVMDGVVMRVVDQFSEAAREIADDADLTAHEKFARIVMGDLGSLRDKEPMIDELHQVENAKMHQKSIVESIIGLTPTLGQVIRQGNAEGTFHSKYPEQTVEILLVANQFLFDSGIFSWKAEEIVEKAEAFVYSMEVLLGTEPGSFNYILEYYKGEIGG